MLSAYSVVVVVVGLQMLTEHFSGLNTGRREVGWLELHAGDKRDGRDGRDQYRLRRKLVREERRVLAV